jgi:hypothetical protein
MDPDPTNIIESLKSVGIGFSEVYQVHAFECYRTRDDGQMQTVQVRILDAGLSAKQPRYRCYAKAGDGRNATGNPGDSIEAALAVVHWGDLDRDW